MTNIEKATTVTYRRIHSKPIYERVESLVILPWRKYQGASNVDNKINDGDVQFTDTDNICIATAGSKGIIRVWKASRNNGGRLPSISNFFLFAEQPSVGRFSEEGGGYVDLLLVPSTSDPNDNENDTFINIESMLLAVDAGHDLSFLNLSTSSTSFSPPILGLLQTVVGCNEEILDLRVIPSRLPLNAQKGRVDDEDGDSISSNDNVNPTVSRTRIVVATNSSRVGIFDIIQSASKPNEKECNDGGDVYSCVSILEGHTDAVLAVDVCPFGQFVITAGKDRSLRLWDMYPNEHHDKTIGERKIESRGGGYCLAVGRDHAGSVGAIALSRSKRGYNPVKGGPSAFAITAGRDKTLRKWNLKMFIEGDREKSEDIMPIEINAECAATGVHDKEVNAVDISPNDSLVATASQDGTVKIWNATDLSPYRGGVILKGHSRGVWDCRFSPSDKVLATAGGDRTVKLWSLSSPSSSSCLRTFQGHVGPVLRVRFLAGGMQLVSSGADGLVKLWTIRTRECEATLDGHVDRVWGLDVALSGGLAMVTGGADSRIIRWVDTTQEEEEKRLDEESKKIQMEQTLANHLRFKEYSCALDISLEMDKPRQALKVLSAIINDDLLKGTQDPTYTLRSSHVLEWWKIDGRVSQILRYCRDWNTRARNSNIAMVVLKSIFSSISAKQLTRDKRIMDILVGIMPYSERHFDRLDTLRSNSYLIDYTLYSMGKLDINDNDDYSKWENSSKLVLPPGIIKSSEGEVDDSISINGDLEEKNINDDDEIVMLGESETESDSSDSDSSLN